MTKTILTSEQLKNMGFDLSGLVNTIETQNLVLDGLEVAEKADKEAFLWMAKKYIHVAYRQNQRIMDKLDNIACILMENDDADEAEGEQ